MARADGNPQEIHIERDPFKPEHWRVMVLWGLMDVEEYAGGRFKTKQQAREYVKVRFGDCKEKHIPIL